MKLPSLAADIERRLLINYRADPVVVAALLPAGLRPQLVDGSAVVGICLIRLGHVRPIGVPRRLGLGSENAAHRIAVEWETGEGLARGVYISRRDSNARANVVVGGRAYPGVHHRATFAVDETERSFHVAYATRDRSVSVDVDATVATELGGSLFASVNDASRFFQAGAVGLSPSRDGCALEGLELCTNRWSVTPVEVHHAWSSYFDDPGVFPAGSTELDCGLLMRDVPVTWIPAPAPNRNAHRGTSAPTAIPNRAWRCQTTRRQAQGLVAPGVITP